MTRGELIAEIVQGLADPESKSVFVTRHLLFGTLLDPKRGSMSAQLGDFTAELLAKHGIRHTVSQLGLEFFRNAVA